MFPEGRALEFLIAAIVALIVVGPKDLPVLLRKLGQFMAKVRSMAAEFRASFDEMARQSELDELRKEVEAMRQGQLADIASHTSDVTQAFNEMSQGLTDVGVNLNPTYPPYGQTTIEAAPIAKPARVRKAVAKAPAKAAASKRAAPKSVAKPAAPKAAAKAKSAPKVAAAKKPTVKAAAKVAAPKAAKTTARKAVRSGS